MSTYKISLLGLFLIILGALIVSILVGNWFSTTEGMVSFQYGKAPLSNIYINKYSGPPDKGIGGNVVLIYDNICRLKLLNS
jgi:hypothetical protein